MITFIQSLNAPLLRATSSEDVQQLKPSIYESTRVISSTLSGEVQISDAFFDQTSGSEYYNEGYILTPSAATFDALTPNIATIDNEGVVSYVSEGVASFIANIDGFKFPLNLSVGYTPNGSSQTFNRWVVGSLGEHMSESLDSLLVGKTKATNGKLLDVVNYVDGVFNRDVGCWASSLDLTGVAVANSRSNGRRSATALTKRHVGFAKHYPLLAGDTVSFLTDGNEVINRNVLSVLSLPDSDVIYPDLSIALLDSDLPVNIAPLKVLPFNTMTEYVPSMTDGRLASFFFDQDQNVNVADIVYYGASLSSGRKYFVFERPVLTDRLEFNELVVVGDSSKPCFVIINGEPVLCGFFTYGGGGAGTAIGGFLNEINSLILSIDAANGVSTGYTLTEANLSSFTSY